MCGTVGGCVGLLGGGRVTDLGRLMCWHLVQIKKWKSPPAQTEVLELLQMITAVQVTR